LARETIGKTFRVAITLAVTCSLIVAGTAVGLRERQQENRQRDLMKNVLAAVGLYDEDIPIEEAFANIEIRLVELETGRYVPEEEIDPEEYRPRSAVRDPDLSISIPADEDVARIRRRAKYAFVGLLQKDGRLDQVVLPVYGKGLWSTMYAFIALDSDLTTIRGIIFYEHAETAGLGGEIDNRAWQAQFVGKKIYDEEGNVRFRVVRRQVDPSSPDAIYGVDTISGATLTVDGVTDLVAYWFGHSGFKRFLDRLREEGGRGG
jgi:Na+-transporting NADH:ubiquinone oxidoreductase subunit C